MFRGRLHGRLFVGLVVLVVVVLLLSGLLVNRIVSDYLSQGTRAEFDDRVARVFRELRRFETTAELREALPELGRLAGVKLTLVTDPEQLQSLLAGRDTWNWGFYWPNAVVPRFRFLPRDANEEDMQEVIPLARDGAVVGVLIVEPRDEAAPARKDLLQTLALVGLVGLGLAILLAWFYSSSLVRPIDRLKRAAVLAGEGRWTQAEAILPADSDDELGTLARQFRRMGEQLQQTMGLLRNERDQLKGFIAELSHELKTPLTAIQTFAELLSEGAADDPEVREQFLEQLGVQVRRLNRLTENLLQLSKLDSGLVELELQELDLRETVLGVVERIKPWAQRKDQRVVLELPEEKVVVEHDPFHAGRMLDNLLSNAVKYTPKGGEIHVQVDTTGDWGRAVIWDTGPGIHADDAGRLFERFFRGRAGTREQREPGSGLGLAIARAVASAHGGSVRLTDPERAEFTVLLPLAGTSAVTRE